MRSANHEERPLAVEHHLSARERQLVEVKLEHATSGQIAAAWEVAPSTVESVARSLLFKTGEPSLSALAQRIWRAARADESSDLETRRDETTRDETTRDETRRDESKRRTKPRRPDR